MVVAVFSPVFGDVRNWWASHIFYSPLSFKWWLWSSRPSVTTVTTPSRSSAVSRTRFHHRWVSLTSLSGVVRDFSGRTKLFRDQFLSFLLSVHQLAHNWRSEEASVSHPEGCIAGMVMLSWSYLLFSWVRLDCSVLQSVIFFWCIYDALLFCRWTASLVVSFGRWTSHW